DDRQLVVGKALNRGPETNRAAIVRHPDVALVRIQKPSEAIAHWLAIGSLCWTIPGLDRCQGWPHFLLAQQGVLAQSAIPFRQVIERRIDPAVAQHGRCGALVRFAPSPVILTVPIRAVRHFILAFLVSQRVFHLERSENSCLKKLAETLA